MNNAIRKGAPVLVALSVFFSGCSGMSQKESSNQIETVTAELQSYAGPGEIYRRFGKRSLTKDYQIIRVEGEWSEVEDLSDRFYMKTGELDQDKVQNAPHVVRTGEENGSVDKPFYHFQDVCALNPRKEGYLYSTPELFDPIGVIHTQEPLVIVSMEEYDEITPIICVEHEDNNGRYRAYADLRELLGTADPDNGFERAQSQNAFIEKNGVRYVSTENTNFEPHASELNGNNYDSYDSEWKPTSQDINKLRDRSGEIVDAKIEWVQTLDPFSNDFSGGERDYMTVRNASLSGNDFATLETQGEENLQPLVDLFYGNSIRLQADESSHFSMADEQTQEFSIRYDLYTHGENQRITLYTAKPWESIRAETYMSKRFDLSEVIYGEEWQGCNSKEKAQEKEDEVIRLMYPELSSAKIVSMEMQFGDTSEMINTFGFNLFFTKDLDLIAVPTLSPNTKFSVFADGRYVTDAAKDLKRCRIKLDDHARDKLIELLGASELYVGGKPAEDPIPLDPIDADQQTPEAPGSSQNVQSGNVTFDQIVGDWKIDTDRTMAMSGVSMWEILGKGGSDAGSHMTIYSDSRFETEGGIEFGFGIGYGGVGKVYLSDDGSIGYVITPYEISEDIGEMIYTICENGEAQLKMPFDYGPGIIDLSGRKSAE